MGRQGKSRQKILKTFENQKAGSENKKRTNDPKTDFA